MIQKRLKQNINTSAIIDNTTNRQDIAQLKIDVANNTQSINTNSQQIGTLQTQVTQNTQDIAGFNQISTDLQTKYNGLESKVTVNEQNIADIKLDADKIDPLVSRVDNIENKYVKKDESNTFTQINTFNAKTNFRNRMELKNTTNNNGIFLENFDYNNKNYTSLKFIKNTSQNYLQIEVNNTDNQSYISSPASNNSLHIQNLANPTNNNDATNKQYVDNADTAISSRVTNIETSLANGNIVNYVGVYDSSTTYKIGQCVTYDNKWYVSKINSNNNNTPSPSSQQWELLSAPTIDLNAYLTKTDASSTYETIANVNALTTKVNTNEQNISTINSTLNDVAKLATDNIFTANNTFNNAITTTGITTASNSDLSLTANGTGRVQVQKDMVMNSHWIAELADPNSPQDAATKHYVDTQNNNNAKLAANNTFSGNNTFTNKITLKNPRNNNGAYLENFDYYNQNYTSLKFVKNNTTAMLILEVNVDANTATISSPTTNNRLYINNLATPTGNDQATNKGYVDNLLSKDINNEQLAPFKIGSTNVYMKYINTPLSISANSQTKTPIPNATGINKLVQCNLSTWGGQVLPWYSGTVKLFLLVENGVLKLESEQGSWVTGIQGVIYYTK